MKLPLDPRIAATPPSPWPATMRGMTKAFRVTPDGYHLTINELAARAGTTRDQILRIQNGEQGMRLRMGLQVARALNRSPWWVLEYSERVQAMAEAVGRRERRRAMRRRKNAKGGAGGAV